MTAERSELACEEVDELAGLYLLDALEPADEDAVRRHLATCANPHPIFKELGGVAPALLRTIEPVEPPAALRERVLAAVATTPQLAATAQMAAPTPIAATTMAPATTASGAEPVNVPARSTSARPISIRAERDRRTFGLGSTWRTLLAAAAVLLIVVLGATTFTFQRQAADAQARANTLSAAIAASLDPTSATASLRGSGAAASAAGFAAFPQNGTGYLVIQGLPQVSADKTYEAWFLAGSTAYPSVLLTPDANGLAIVQGVTMTQGADTVALTVEPAGGSQAPTSAPIVVGKVEQGPVATAIVGQLGTSSR